MQQSYALNSLDAWGKRYTDKMRQISEDEKALKAELEKVVKEITTINTNPEPTNGTGTTGSPDDDALNARKALLEQQYREEVNLLRKSTWTSS